MRHIQLLGAALFGLFSASPPTLAQTPAPAPAAAPAPLAPAAAPEETADTLLVRTDKQNAAFSDAFFHFKMVVKSATGAVEREIEFTTKQKGKAKRLVRFLSPGDLKGMGFLLASPGEMYAKLPAFGNRIRRIGTSQMNQGFLGSDLTTEDMSTIDYAPMYAATHAGAEGSLRVLQLQLKPGMKSGFPRLKMWIDPKTATITKIEYNDDAGKKLRTSERFDFKQDGPGHFSPGKMTYTDHRLRDHKTDMILVKSSLNNGYKDDEFTQRALQMD